MKRGIKILLGILIPIVVLCITYVILVFKGILPNPFLDTKDLVCSRELKIPEYIKTEIMIVQFDKFGITKNYKDVYKLTYEDIELLNEFEKYLKSMNKKYQIDKDSKSIMIEENFEVESTNNYYQKTKEEMRDIILNELYYTKCE